VNHSKIELIQACQIIRLNDSLFALKQLHDKDYNNEEKFRKETEQLQRFNGLVHNHLVTLLATFTFQKRFYFLFPYAEFDLDRYWEHKERNPEMDVDTVRWVAKQCSGIMAGIDAIHEPQTVSLQGLNEKKYGRHGDIKPDNILWFNTSSDPKGILVISDMGLSALNRETSRSGLARYNIPRVPGYSPPECDVKGGTISRAYDIWTLGCLFLEQLTWLLGGSDFRKEFEAERTTEYSLTGSKNNIFFALKLKKQPGQPDVLVAQVKDEVSRVRSLKPPLNCVGFCAVTNRCSSGSIICTTIRNAPNIFMMLSILLRPRCLLSSLKIERGPCLGL
jgi:serine/threonine protein kinase